MTATLILLALCTCQLAVNVWLFVKWQESAAKFRALSGVLAGVAILKLYQYLKCQQKK